MFSSIQLNKLDAIFLYLKLLKILLTK